MTQSMPEAHGLIISLQVRAEVHLHMKPSVPWLAVTEGSADDNAPLALGTTQTADLHWSSADAMILYMTSIIDDTDPLQATVVDMKPCKLAPSVELEPQAASAHAYAKG